MTSQKDNKGSFDGVRLRKLALVGAAAAVLVGGGSTAAVAAVTDTGVGISPDAPTVTAVTTTPGVPAPVGPPTSQARLSGVVAQIGLLQQPATAQDVLPARYAPSDPSAPGHLDAASLARARRVPGAGSTWVIPLLTGGLEIVTPHGGAIYSPSQVTSGGVVFVSEDGSDTTVTGIVPDGTKAVAIKSGAGTTTALAVRRNSYSHTFDASVDGSEPASVTLTLSGGVKKTAHFG